MEKIYEKADEEHVAAFIVYGSLAKTEGADNKLFEDSAFSKYLDAEEVYRAYLNNRLIIMIEDEGMGLRPIAHGWANVPPVYDYSTCAVDGSGTILWTVAVDPGDGGGR